MGKGLGTHPPATINTVVVYAPLPSGAAPAAALHLPQGAWAADASASA